jgi:hypothetical protein
MAERALDYHTPKKRRGPVVFRLLAALIGSILVLAVLCILIVVSVISSFSAPSSVTFHVLNRTSFRIDSFIFTSPRGDDELGPIGPGESREIKVKTAYNFQYRYVTKVNGRPITGVAAIWNDDDAEGYTRDQDISIDATTDGNVKVEYAIGRR